MDAACHAPAKAQFIQPLALGSREFALMVEDALVADPRAQRQILRPHGRHLAMSEALLEVAELAETFRPTLARRHRVAHPVKPEFIQEAPLLRGQRATLRRRRWRATQLPKAGLGCHPCGTLQEPNCCWKARSSP